MSVSLLLLVALSLSVGATAIAETQIEKTRQLYWDAYYSDELGNSKGVPEIEGGYRSPFGIQVHPACFKTLELDGAGRAEAELKLERWFLSVFATVKKCESKYPELKPYLSEWVSQFRRTRIACSMKSMNEIGFGAINLAFGAQWAALTPSERAGLDLNEPLESLPRRYRTIIMLPRNSLSKVLALDDWLKDTLIHEVLHSTHANNRWDHNRVESKVPGADRCSDEDIRADRVNVVASLCSGDGLGHMKLSTEEVFFRRMSECGRAKCERFFSENKYDTGELMNEISGYWMPMGGLSKMSAAALCSRIYNEGLCRSDQRNWGPQQTFGDPILSALGERIRKRLDRVFVPAVARLGPELLALFPKDRDKIKSRSSTACYRSVFRENTRGALLLQVRNTLGVSTSVSSPDRVFLATLKSFRLALSGSENCSALESDAVVADLDAIEAKVKAMFSTHLYESLIKPRYLGQTELDYLPRDRKKTRPRRNLRALVGEALINEYLSALFSRHHASPGFSCSGVLKFKH